MQQQKFIKAEFISQNLMFKTSIRYSTVVGLAAEVYHVMPRAH